MPGSRLSQNVARDVNSWATALNQPYRTGHGVSRSWQPIDAVVAKMLLDLTNLSVGDTESRELVARAIRREHAAGGRGVVTLRSGRVGLCYAPDWSLLEGWDKRGGPEGPPREQGELKEQNA
jgi:hypothetical protein